ncbi:MAG TPA: TetR/AcrR family transcriptional regulator [Phycisphaerales bacterium]|nr:TetR/AcrR family transcriptional regulator [Phycisphaerales bacterium]
MGSSPPLSSPEYRTGTGSVSGGKVNAVLLYRRARLGSAVYDRTLIKLYSYQLPQSHESPDEQQSPPPSHNDSPWLTHTVQWPYIRRTSPSLNSIPAMASSKSNNKRGRPIDEELAARRRNEILDAATHLFASDGYRQADVQVLADRLGVGKGTVYRYFSSKEELFLASVDRGMQRLKEAVESAAADVADPLDEIGAAIRAYLAFFDDNGDVLELMIQERAEFKDRKRSTYFVYRDTGYEPWRALYRRLMSEGRVREMPVDRVLDVLGDLVYGAIFTNRLAGRKKPFDVQAEEILDVVMHGILTSAEKRKRKRRGLTQRDLHHGTDNIN